MKIKDMSNFYGFFSFLVLNQTGITCCNFKAQNFYPGLWPPWDFGYIYYMQNKTHKHLNSLPQNCTSLPMEYLICIYNMQVVNMNIFTLIAMLKVLSFVFCGKTLHVTLQSMTAQKDTLSIQLLN